METHSWSAEMTQTYCGPAYQEGLPKDRIVEEISVSPSFPPGLSSLSPLLPLFPSKLSLKISLKLSLTIGYKSTVNLVGKELSCP